MLSFDHSVIMYPAGYSNRYGAMSGNSGDSRDNDSLTNKLLNRLKETESRAKQAEKQYLSLKADVLIKAKEEEIKSCEQEFHSKMRLYEKSEQQDFIVRSFQAKTEGLYNEINSIQKVYKLCGEVIEKGLRLSELPSLESYKHRNFDDIELELFKKATASMEEHNAFKREIERSTKLISDARQSQQFAHRLPPPNQSLQSHMLAHQQSQYNMGRNQSYVTQVGPTSINTTLFRMTPKSNNSTPASNNSQYTQQISSSAVSQQPVVTSNNHVDNHGTRENHHSSADSPHQTDQTSNGGDQTSNGVDGLEDFVIEDDEMFSSDTEEKLSNGGTQSMNNESDTNNLNIKEPEAIAKQEGHKDKKQSDDDSDNDAASVDDDEEYVKRMASLWKVTGKSLQKINWKHEVYSDIVKAFASQMRISVEQAEQDLDSAYKKIGSLDDIDRIFSEAKATRNHKRLQGYAASLSKTSPRSESPLLPATANPVASISTGAATKSTPSTTGNAFSSFKTRLCEHWKTLKKCPHGDYCMFAHGQSELRSLPQKQTSWYSPNSYYKVIMCRNYEAGLECPYGSACIFAHGEHELRTGDQSTQSAGDSNEPHPEPCDSQQCPAKLNYLMRKTSLCAKNDTGQCRYGMECRFAHGSKDLLPMPKWELCERHIMGRCCHGANPAKCVYAHSESELNPKPPHISKLQAEHKKAAAAKLQQRKIVSKGQTGAWGSNNVAHPQQASDDDCLICLGPLTERKKLLQCGHDGFHVKCITQWVNEGLPYCPVCRTPAKLPDLFKAPAGMKPDEFPSLRF